MGKNKRERERDPRFGYVELQKSVFMKAHLARPKFRLLEIKSAKMKSEEDK